MTTPTSPTAKFTQPLSSPTALYTDVPLPSSLEATSASTLGGFGAGSLFAKGISAGEKIVIYFVYTMALGTLTHTHTHTRSHIVYWEPKHPSIEIYSHVGACIDLIFSLFLAPPVANPAENMPQMAANRQAPSAAAAATWGHVHSSVGIPSLFSDSAEPRKKKYAKEAWPGKKPPQHLLV